MIAIGYLRPKTPEEIKISDQQDPSPVDMTPWPYAKNTSYAIVGITIFIYLLLTLVSK